MNTATNVKAPAQVNQSGKLIYSSIKINAAPQKIWSILMDFDAYPSWNPFIRSVSGSSVAGQYIRPFIYAPGQSGRQFKALVLQNRANKELRWIGTLISPFLFSGEHAFILDDNGDGTTTFHHFEHFRGILVPIMKRMLDTNVLQGFNEMNEQLKKRAELA